MNWLDCVEAIRPYIVSIESPDLLGTAFLFTYNKDKTIAGFATAAHILEHVDAWKQPIRLIHCTTKKELFVPDTDRVIFLDLKRDSASIILFKNSPSGFDIGLPQDTLPLISADRMLRVGVEVGWLGFPSIAHPNLCFFTGRISTCLQHHDSYLIDGVAINGVSGGPVFYIPAGNSSPQIIGTVTAYMPNKIHGDTLPGLLRVQDITSFQTTIETLKNHDDAREKKDKQTDEEARQTPTASND
jgi:hypothetical protein